MVEGTRFAKLEAVTIEFHKNQISVEGRLGTLEESVNSCKESISNLEVMMQNFLQSTKDKLKEVASVTNPQIASASYPQFDIGSTGIFIGKGLKVDVPRFNITDAED